jgi:hypothetical protein
MRKNGAGHAGQALRGSGDFHAWIDSGLYLKHPRDRLLLIAEHRDAPSAEPIELRLVSRPDGSATHLEVVDLPDPSCAPSAEPTPLGDRLVDLLRASARPCSRWELRKRLRVNNQRLGQELASLEQRGLLVRAQQGWSWVENT